MSEFCKMPGSDGPVYPLTTRKLRMGFIPCDADGKLPGAEAPKADAKPKVAKAKPAPVAETTPLTTVEQPIGE